MERCSVIRIMHLITDLDIGGAEMMLYRVLSRLDRQIFDHLVVSLKPVGPVSKKIRSLGIPVCDLGMKPGTVPIRAPLRLAQLVLAWRPTVIQTWLYHADLTGFLVAKATRVKNVVWNIRCSNMDFQRHGGSINWIVRFCAMLSRFPQAVITNSDSGKAYHKRLGYNPKRFLVISNGFDTNLFSPEDGGKRRLSEELGIGKDSRFVGLIARFDPMKDHKTFLSAASRVFPRFKDVHFVLIGHGVDPGNKTLCQWIEGAGLEPHIHLLGQRQELEKILPGLDIVCSSSAYGEGFSNVIGEAMSCGVPCVVTDVGDSARIVGETGKVVPPRAPDALAKAILELLELPPGERRELGELARERIQRHYSLDKIVGEYEKLYLDIVACRCGQPGKG